MQSFRDEVSLERSKREPFYFYRRYFENYCHNTFADHHHNILNVLGSENAQRPCVAIVPRGSGLSTLLSMEILRQLCTEPNRFVVCFTQNTKVAKYELTRLYNMYMHNMMLLRDVGENVQRIDQGLLLPNGSMVMYRGWQQRVLGCFHKYTRPQLIIGHDLETMSARQNTTVRTEMYDSVFCEWLPALNPAESGGGNLLLCGTPGHRKSIYHKVSEHPMTAIVYQQALFGDEYHINQLLKHVTTYAVQYMDRESHTFHDDFLQSVVDLCHPCMSYWEDRYSIVSLLQFCMKVGLQSFLAEYQHVYR